MPNMVSVAPGVFIDPLVRKDLKPADTYVLLDAPGLRSIGLSTSQDKMVRRLEHAGMIKTFQITPRRRLLDLSSWRDHLRAVTQDPEFWERPQNRRRWKLAIQCV